MILYESHLGTVRISENYLAKLIGNAVSSCYGVTNMVPKGAQWVRSKLLMKRTFADTGIQVRGNKPLTVDLHISVMHGLNISAISNSIVHKVKYTVEEATGISVARVRVHVDRMNEE